MFSFCSPRQRGMDDTGARYITEKLTEQTKNYQGGAKQSEQSYSDVRMDPVAAFEFYLSKTHPDCKALFQTPNKATTKNINFASTRHWYRNEPMEKNTISKMMERIAIKAELSERYTNHCIRASTVSHFFVPARCGRQHIQIGTMNIYHGKYEEPSPSTCKRRRIIESNDSD